MDSLLCSSQSSKPEYPPPTAGWCGTAVEWAVYWALLQLGYTDFDYMPSGAVDFIVGDKAVIIKELHDSAFTRAFCNAAGLQRVELSKDDILLNPIETVRSQL